MSDEVDLLADTETVDLREPTYVLRVGAASHIGLHRERNEDHFAVVRRTRSRSVLATNLPDGSLRFEDEHAHVLTVADGMGGESFGDVASRLVVQAGAETAAGVSNWLMNLNGVGMDEVRNRVQRYVDSFVQALKSHPLSREPGARMGTTWTCAYLMGRDVLVAHVGDSRAYVFRSGQLVRLTSDHTVASRLMELGVAEDEAQRYRNVLENYFGTGKETVDFDLEHLQLKLGEKLLLCTDGLTDMAPESEIAETLQASGTPQTAADQLVERALAHGGRDNVTVIVAELAHAEA